MESDRFAPQPRMDRMEAYEGKGAIETGKRGGCQGWPGEVTRGSDRFGGAFVEEMIKGGSSMINLYEFLSHSWFTGILVVGVFIALLFFFFGARRRGRGTGTE